MTAKAVSPTYDKLNEEIEKYQLALFKPSIYVLPQFKDQYQGETNVRNFSQENREKFLIGMMKVNFLKRLESSVKSFGITMERTVTKISIANACLHKERRKPAKRH